MPALILMYHDLSENLADVAPEHRPYVIETSIFRLQMRLVAAAQLPVLTVSQWSTPSRPPRAIALTFDDGHMSNHDIALPILLEYQLKATFLITAGLIGTGATMNWRQIRALHAAGMEIGSHTLTHRPPSTLSDDELRHELIESRRILEDGLGALVTSISSPTGFFNPRMCVIARDVGYRTLSFGKVGLAAHDGDPFRLNRVAVKHDIGAEKFEALLRFHHGVIRRLRRRQWTRDLARKTLSPQVYLYMRHRLIRGRRMR